MQGDQVLALFKFGIRAHIDEFVREGHLFMNTLKYFREREADLLRSDKHEGAAHCLQAEGAKLRRKCGDEWVDIGTISGQILSSDGSEDTMNVFCMYAFRESAADGLVDPRNFEFGDTYAVLKLKDCDEFLRRVQVAAVRENLEFKQGFVEYVARPAYNGPMGAFRKFADFSYQCEFRIAVVSGIKAPFSLRIGDLSDILMTGNLANLNERIGENRWDK